MLIIWGKEDLCTLLFFTLPKNTLSKHSGRLHNVNVLTDAVLSLYIIFPASGNCDTIVMHNLNRRA